jgi:hypothetical protein
VVLELCPLVLRLPSNDTQMPPIPFEVVESVAPVSPQTPSAATRSAGRREEVRFPTALTCLRGLYAVLDHFTVDLL